VASFTVVYDACVLYPAAVRDLLIEVARSGLFRAKWTARIHREWIDAVLRTRKDLQRSQLERAAALMDRAVPDCLVTGFEGLEGGLAALPDPNDHHVLAAAIHSGAQEIVTFNLRDFPDGVLSTYRMAAIHPDTFVEHLLDLNPEVVCQCVRRIRSRLIRPPQSVEQQLEKYERQGLAVSASILRRHADSL
jgi:PIN domain-containing protein